MDIEQPTSQRTIIFAGGDILTTPSPDLGAFVIAADSGYDHAVALGHTVDLLIGDLDSISEDGMTHAEATGAAIDRHPISKDATDLELALDVATNRGASSIDIFGGEGGRIDHLLGVAAGLTKTSRSGIDLTWHTATGTIRPLVDGGHIHVDEAEGTVMSLIVVSDSVGVTTRGLRWQLSGETLHRGTSRGLSNEIVRTPASVSLDNGAILVIADSGLRS